MHHFCLKKTKGVCLGDCVLCWNLSLLCSLNLGGQLGFVLCPAQFFGLFFQPQEGCDNFFPFRGRAWERIDWCTWTQHTWPSLKLPVQPHFGGCRREQLFYEYRYILKKYLHTSYLHICTEGDNKEKNHLKKNPLTLTQSLAPSHSSLLHRGVREATPRLGALPWPRPWKDAGGSWG